MAAAFISVKNKATRKDDKSLVEHEPDPLEQTDVLLSSLPDRRRTGWMEKRFEHSTSGPSKWLPRFAVLTAARLVFAKSDNDDGTIVDYIPLAEILSVEIVDAVDQESSPLASPASKVSPSVQSNSLRQIPVHCEDDEQYLVIRTMESGHNSGRTYIHRLPREDAALWHSELKMGCERARFELERDSHRSGLSYFRAKTLSLYEAKRTQLVIAFVIVLAFAIDVSEAQILPPEGSEQAFIFLIVEIAITSFFTLELLLHIFCKSNDCFRPFVRRKMNLFDTAVVAVSIASLALQFTSTQVPSLKMLRLVRVVRVLRLFKRLQSLNKIMKAIISSLLPVCNSLCILLVCLTY